MNDNTREIRLGRSGKVALVDEEDFHFLSQWKWYWNGYAQRMDVTTTSDGKRKNKAVFMHREILSAPPGYCVDHANRNKLDNRKSNLRVATRSQNGANRAISRLGASGFKGVLMSGSSGAKWLATIVKDCETLWLGSYNGAEEAAWAYNQAAIHYFGEFAVLNKVGPPKEPATYTELESRLKALTTSTKEERLRQKKERENRYLKIDWSDWNEADSSIGIT